MPPAVVQSNFATYSASVITIATPGNVTANNLLICAFLMAVSGSNTVTDSRSSSWTRIIQVTGGGLGSLGELWWARAASTGADTISITNNSGSSGCGVVYEISGITTTGSPVDGTPMSAFSSTTNYITGAGFSGLVSSTDFIFYFAGQIPPSNVATGGGWTDDFRATISGNPNTDAVYALGGPTVTTPHITTNQAGQFWLIGAAFAPSGGSVTGTATLSLGPITLSASGTPSSPGSGTATLALGPITLTTIAAATGTSALPLGPVTVTATGTPLGTATGTANVALGPITTTVNVYHTYIFLGPITVTVATSLSGGGGLATLVESVQL